MQKENGNEGRNGSQRSDMNLTSLRLDVLLAPVSGALTLTVGKLLCLLIAIPERIQDVQPYCSSHMIWLVTAGANEQGASASWHCGESARRPGEIMVSENRSERQIAGSREATAQRRNQTFKPLSVALGLRQEAWYILEL